MVVTLGCLAQYSENIEVVLENTKPLEYDRGGRLPLYLWPLIDPGELTPTQAEALVADLDARGVALVAKWTKDNQKQSLELAMTIGRAQKKLGAGVHINAIDLLYSFFNGDESTAHIDADSNTFWDDGFGRKKDMGCPFAIDFRKDEIRERVEFYLLSFVQCSQVIDHCSSTFSITNNVFNNLHKFINRISFDIKLNLRIVLQKTG